MRLRLVLPEMLVLWIVAANASAAERAAQRVAPPTTPVSSVPAPQHTARSLDASTTVSYKYDSLGRLIRDERLGSTLTYAYDPAGNRIQSTVQH